MSASGEEKPRDDSNTPFDEAAAAARASLSEPIPPGPTSPESGPAQPVNEDGEESVTRRRRGRGRNRSTTRARRVGAGDGAPAAAQQPAAKKEAVTVPPIDPAKVSGMIRQLDKNLARILGMRPLDEQEIKDGGEWCAPVLDHYAPIMLSKPWAPAVMWAAMVYTPRVGELIHERSQGGKVRKQIPFSEPTVESMAADSARPVPPVDATA